MNKILFTFCLSFILFPFQDMLAQTPTGNYVPAYKQEQSNWCWAACGSMLYWAYHSGSISQCSFVAKSRDQENALLFDCNSLSSSTSSPCTYPGTFNSPQSLYTCGGSIENVFDTYGISSTGYGHGFSTSKLTTAMSGKKMCIARWGWNNGGGHFVVVNRYKSGVVYYNNPLSGATSWSYNTFKTANGQATWTHTLRLDNAASYGSVYYKAAGIITQDPAILSSGTLASTDREVAEANGMTINIYPNPTVDQATIMLNTNRETASQLIITNSMGQTIYCKKLSNQSNYIKIDVSNWARGVYQVKLQGTRFVKQLIVR